MDLPKDYDCLPHDLLLIAKHEADDLDKHNLNFVNYYLNFRK